MTYSDHDTQRWAHEPPKRVGRTQFQRDRARVLHSAALRRLAAKTQVVEVGSGDFPRTRLTHSLECAQIGRELGAALGCDADLVDAACLAHDIGHPPFGHNGESALAHLAAFAGGFEGNAQSLRLLTRLEPKVPGAGLNLTRAVLDATLKYPWLGGDGVGGDGVGGGGVVGGGGGGGVGGGGGKYGAYADDEKVFGWIREGAPDGRRCLEAQVMDWADDVAYSVHDLEDGLHSGLITLENLQDHNERAGLTATALSSYCMPAWNATQSELDEVFADFIRLPCWQFGFFDGGQSALAALAALAALKNLTSELVGRFCRAAETATLEAAGRGGLTRYAADLIVPRAQLLECALLKAVAARYVMSREGAAAAQARERELIAELAEAIERGAPDTLDPLLRPAWHEAGSAAQARRVVVDQIASLTDTSAIVWHRRLCQ